MEAADTAALEARRVALGVAMVARSMEMGVVSVVKTLSYAIRTHSDEETTSRSTMLAMTRRALLLRLKGLPLPRAQARSRGPANLHNRNRKLRSKICLTLEMNLYQHPQSRVPALELRHRIRWTTLGHCRAVPPVQTMTLTISNLQHLQLLLRQMSTLLLHFHHLLQLQLRHLPPTSPPLSLSHQLQPTQYCRHLRQPRQLRHQ